MRDGRNQDQLTFIFLFAVIAAVIAIFSVVADRDDLIDRYVKAITEELDSLKRPLLDTLFLGGGTPTHLSNSHLNKLLESLNQLFDLNELTEFSVEANPEDIDQEKLDCLQSWGVNRISFGIQSFRGKTEYSAEKSYRQRSGGSDRTCSQNF